MLNGPYVINVLIDAQVIMPGVTGVQLNAQTNGHLSIHTEYIVKAPESGTMSIEEDELIRLRAIEQMASKMVKLQLEDGQVDDRLAENLRQIIDG